MSCHCVLVFFALYRNFFVRRGKKNNKSIGIYNYNSHDYYCYSLKAFCCTVCVCVCVLRVVFMGHLKNNAVIILSKLSVHIAV